MFNQVSDSYGAPPAELPVQIEKLLQCSTRGGAQKNWWAMVSGKNTVHCKLWYSRKDGGSKELSVFDVNKEIAYPATQ